MSAYKMPRCLQVLAVCLAVACGSSSPGPYPWVTGELVPVRCADEGFDCFVLIVTGHGKGSALGTCRVLAIDVDFTPLSENELDAAFETEQFAFVSGQELRFPVQVPKVDDERFLRWQANCDPGMRM